MSLVCTMAVIKALVNGDMDAATCEADFASTNLECEGFVTGIEARESLLTGWYGWRKRNSAVRVEAAT